MTAKHPMGCLHPSGSPRCGSVQTCWRKLVTRNSLWAVSTLRAHRFAIRSKLAGASLSNRVVLIPRRGPYTKKPHCVQWGFLYMVHSGGLTRKYPWGYFYPLGSPRCGSVQACWSNLVEPVVLIPRRGPYTKKPLSVVEFCVCW